MATKLISHITKSHCNYNLVNKKLKRQFVFFLQKKKRIVLIGVCGMLEGEIHTYTLIERENELVAVN